MEKIRIDEFLNFQFLSEPKLNPAGSAAAFVASRSNEERDGYDGGIWTVDLAAPEHPCRRLTAGKDETSFLWLSDHSILFSSKRDSKKDSAAAYETVYYEISLNGGEAEERMRIPLPVKALRRLSEDRWLVLAEYDGTLPEGFYEADRKERERILEERKEEGEYKVFTELPFWGNGQGVTNGKRARLYLFEEKTGQLKALTGPSYQVETFSLSEDRSRLLYAGQEFQGVMSQKQELRELDLETLESKVLVEQGVFEIKFAGYGGDRIMVLATDHKLWLNENHGVYEYDREARALRFLSKPDMAFGSSTGSDCRLGGGQYAVLEENGLTCIATQRKGSNLVHIGWDGIVENLTDLPGSVDSMDKKQGKLVYVAMRDNRLQELYLLAPESGSGPADPARELQLTCLNEQALSGKYVAEPKPLTFTNSDGVEIDGWVLEPMEYDPAKTWPAILDIHGGPKTAYGTCFFHEMQYWASQGYFVFFCNPRGSDSRGDAFSFIQGRYGCEDYQDVMEFTDQVLKAYPQIDKNRLGVTGGSYGGFMTNWIICHTDRFAAAASQRSVVSWISMEGTSDIGYYFDKDQTGGNPWENMEAAWRQSPLKYADHCKTPTLFIHSDQDYRCYMAEGLQMFSALRVHGVTTRMCLFHGENHELSRSGMPRHRLRRLREITEWMDTYLKKQPE